MNDDKPYGPSTDFVRMLLGEDGDNEPDLAPEPPEPPIPVDYDKLFDQEGVEIKVGTMVIGDPKLPAGEVVAISDVDGDVDDEGRSVVYPPTVRVKWEDHDEPEVFYAHWNWDNDTWQVDDVDVEVIPHQNDAYMYEED